jgi:hypothetical protein
VLVVERRQAAGELAQDVEVHARGAPGLRRATGRRSPPSIESHTGEASRRRDLGIAEQLSNSIDTMSSHASIDLRLCRR